MTTHLYHPKITFADTNVVGNVYFANYFRWQDECRNEWLKRTAAHGFEEVTQGRKRLRVSEVSFEYLDPRGVTIAEPIEVEMQFEMLGVNAYGAATSVRRCAMVGDVPPIAKGRQRFELVGGSDVLAKESQRPEDLGQAYKLALPISLELFRWNGWLDTLEMIGWQGKCREQFLIDHADETLELVADRRLALHTSKVGLQLTREVRLSNSDQLGIEMRLTHLRGGRMTVCFDYFVLSHGLRTSREFFATGSQSIACKRPSDGGLAPAVFPADMLLALRVFANSPSVIENIDAALEFQRDDKDDGIPELTSNVCVNALRQPFV